MSDWDGNSEREKGSDGLLSTLTAFGLLAAAMLAPPPLALLLGTVGVAIVGGSLFGDLAGCLSGDPASPCGWTQPNQEPPCDCSPAAEPIREIPQPGRGWVEATGTARQNPAPRGRQAQR